MSDEKLDLIIQNQNDLCKKVDSIEQALKGYNGQAGLLKSHQDLKEDYYKFKRCVLVVSAFLAGTGALGVSIWQLIKAAAGM